MAPVGIGPSYMAHRVEGVVGRGRRDNDISLVVIAVMESTWSSSLSSSEGDQASGSIRVHGV